MQYDELEINREKKKKTGSSLLNAGGDMNEDDLHLTYFSKYLKTLRMIAWIFRFIFNTRNPINKRKGTLTEEEIGEAETFIVKRLQRDSLYENDKRWRNLQSFRDENGVIRVKSRTKKILKGIDGKFSTGRLTAILGASGAGKTSLLNILAGQIHVNVNGTIKVNGKHRDMRTFHKMSSYIMQEDLLQPFLTVGESMKTAAKLKLGRDFSNEAKEDTIREIIKLIGLKECVDIEVEKLSGGQRKRLSIALELVNNPPVIFLDEPTSGLDNVTMKNCIDLLKSLTLQGRTIICTIHQPSDSIFEMFDHVYFMSDGCCIYNGEVNNIVPYLDSVGLPCPKTYSPADYIIELVHFNRENNELLCQRMVNEINSMSTNEEIKKKQADNGDDHYSFDFPNSFWHQFWILTCRMFLQLSRNKLMLGLQFGHHIICGVFLGSMFYQIGNDGRYAAVNMKFYYGVVTYYFFTHLMSPVLLFPFEVKLMQREYFNRWYGLKAYYLASTITMMPILIINAILFTLIIYPMTGQPLELDKFFWFLFFSVFTAISAQGLGYAVGSIFPPTSGACIGSAIAIPLVLLGIYGIGFGETIEPTMKTLQYFSFPYHSFVGIATALMDGRDTFECEDIFCYFGDPEMMLRIMGMHDKTYVSEAAFMVFFMLLHRVLSYIFLRFRVSQEFALLTSRYIGQIK